MSLSLQKLDYNDKNLLNKLFEWRNEENTRMNSLHTELISFDVFKKIIDKYKESKIDPFIIYLDDLPIGVISFVINNTELYVGINIDKDYRGKGIGNKSIELLLKELKNIKIIAKIKKTNISSIKLFSKYFKYYQECNQFIEYIYEC